MAYITQNELKGLIPDEYLSQAMDDESAGAATDGVWASISAAVDEEIDGRLAASYATPIAPAPKSLKAAAKSIALCLIYKRRGIANDQNPWVTDAEYWRKKLDEIGQGKQPLQYDSAKAAEPAVLISEAAKTHSASGHLMV
jgi:hypothetical protein